MKTYEIECEGETHRIGLDDEGYLHALDHDEHEMVLAIMGEEAPKCIDFILTLENAGKKPREDFFIEASGHGKRDIVELMLDVGTDVHAENDWAFQFAAKNGHLEVVEFLLELGADVHADDDLALKLAAEDGHLDVVEFLLGAGANVHVRDDEVLRGAAEYGHLEVVEFLENWIEEHG